MIRQGIKRAKDIRCNATHYVGAGCGCHGHHVAVEDGDRLAVGPRRCHRNSRVSQRASRLREVTHQRADPDPRSRIFTQHLDNKVQLSGRTEMQDPDLDVRLQPPRRKNPLRR